MPFITQLCQGRKIGAFLLSTGQDCTIGRLSENDIVVNEATVSEHHARIEAVASTFVLRDLDSTCGTFVNSRQISIYNLRHGDRITVGSHTLLYDLNNQHPENAGDVMQHPPDSSIITQETEGLSTTPPIRKHPFPTAPAEVRPPSSTGSASQQHASFLERILRKLS